MRPLRLGIASERGALLAPEKSAGNGSCSLALPSSLLSITDSRMLEPQIRLQQGVVALPQEAVL